MSPRGGRWARLLPLAVACLLFIWCGSWVLASAVFAVSRPLAWPIDVGASVVPQVAFVSLVVGAVFVLRGRWRAGLICGAGWLVGLAAFVPGRAWTTGEAVRPEQTVRVAVVNAHGDSGDEAKLRALLERDDLDAIALLETPFWLVGELKAGAWRSRYPQHWLSDAANTGFPVLLTKWRQHEIETLSEGAHRVAKPPGHETILARPGGAFGLTVFHPRSPRSPARWRLAHELVDLVIARQREHIVDRGIPMVLMGDLNSPPSALHSRRVTGALDGRRAKPLLAATGTFPTMLPWPARVAIDDVIVGAGVRVVGWETADVGSDHKAVIVTLEVPLGRGPSLRSD